VRAKQRPFYHVFLVNSELRVIGFAPRQRRRSTAIFLLERLENKYVCRQRIYLRGGKPSKNQDAVSTHLPTYPKKEQRIGHTPSNQSMGVRARQRLC
jgi:hypothetical protein